MGLDLRKNGGFWEMENCKMKQIGIIHSPFKECGETPIQPIIRIGWLEEKPGEK